MKRLVLEPQGWPCTLEECPPGLFLHRDSVGFKTEYRAMESVGPTNVPGDEVRWRAGRHPDAYCESGEYLCTADPTTRDEIMVQPLVASWEDA
jgi:hypothetical protein